MRDFLLEQDTQELLARRVKIPFDVRACLCRALLVQIKPIASLIPNHDINVLDIDDDRFYSFTELTTLLSRMIDRVLLHVHEIEKSRGKRESSILDEIKRVILCRNNLRANSLPVGLEIQHLEVLGLGCFNQRGWLLGKAITTDLTVYVKQKLESDPRYNNGGCLCITQCRPQPSA